MFNIFQRDVVTSSLVIKHKLLIYNLYILLSGYIGKFIFSDNRKNYKSNNCTE